MTVCMKGWVFSGEENELSFGDGKLHHLEDRFERTKYNVCVGGGAFVRACALTHTYSFSNVCLYNRKILKGSDIAWLVASCLLFVIVLILSSLTSYLFVILRSFLLLVIFYGYLS